MNKIDKKIQELEKLNNDEIIERWNNFSENYMRGYRYIYKNNFKNIDLLFKKASYFDQAIAYGAYETNEDYITVFNGGLFSFNRDDDLHHQIDFEKLAMYELGFLGE